MSLDNVQEVLLKRGPLRPGQWAMAERWDQAIVTQDSVLVVAPTGTGKSLAALLPPLTRGLRVIYSTATKSLQQQVYHEVPELGYTAAVLRGTESYVCIRNAHKALDDKVRGVHSSILTMEEPPADYDFAMRKAVTTPSDACLNIKCEYKKTCPFMRSKERASKADVVVVNHSYFIARRGWPDATDETQRPTVLVIDEAHKFPEIARSALETVISVGRCRNAYFLAEAILGQERNPAGSDSKRRVHELAQLQVVMAPILKKAGERHKRGVVEEGKAPFAHEEMIALRAHIESLTILGKLPLVTSSHGVDDEGFPSDPTEDPKMVSHKAALRKLAEDILRAFQPAPASDAEEGTIAHGFYFDINDQETTLICVPKSVATLARQKATGFAVLYCTATAPLSLAKDLDVDPANVLSVESPLPFKERSLLYVPDDPLLHGISGEGTALRTEIIERLVAASKGGALILSPSNARMTTYADRLRPLARKLGIRLYCQGDDIPANLARKFRDDRDSILVATRGFFEGFDVPGDSLRLVICESALLSPPSARLETVAGSDSAAFRAGHEQASVDLAQATGRLMRTANCRGVVAILDSRLSKPKSYNHRILGSLLPFPNIVHDIATPIAWLESIAGSLA